MMESSGNEDATQDEKNKERRAKMHKSLDKCIDELFDVWDDMGFSNEEQDTRCNRYNEQMESLVESENKLRQKLIKAIEDLVKQMNLLCQELGLSLRSEEVQDNALPLMLLNSEMKRRIKSLTEQKEERLRELHELLDKDTQICKELGTAPFMLDPNKLPSEAQLATLSGHIANLTSEKATRKKKLADSRAAITQLMIELETGPQTQFEKEVIRGKPENFVIVTENMHKLRQLQEKLEDMVRTNEAEGCELRNKLQRLWARLNFEPSVGEDFLTRYHGSRPSTLKMLQAEVTRCEELKMQNIKQFVEQMRTELAHLWDRCFYSREQRALFKPFDDGNYTEELLEVHEREVDRLRDFAEKADTILKKATLWEELFKKMLEIEKKGNDANRFTNRGGNLLQEEKERKTILVRLPKIEKDLCTAVSDWERENESPFLVYGKRIADNISDQWAQFSLDKENERQMRQQAKAQQLQQDMLGFSKTVTPAKKRALNTPGRANNVLKKSRLCDAGSSTIVSPAVRNLTFTRKPPSHRVASNKRPVTRRQAQRKVLAERAPCPNVSVASTVAESEFVNYLAEQRKLGPFNSTTVNEFPHLAAAEDRAGVGDF